MNHFFGGLLSNGISVIHIFFATHYVFFLRHVYPFATFLYWFNIVLITVFLCRKLKNTIDPNLIQLDPTPLLNIEIDNIKLLFKKLLDNLQQKVDSPDDEDDGDVEGTQFEPKPTYPEILGKEYAFISPCCVCRAVGWDQEEF